MRKNRLRKSWRVALLIVASEQGLLSPTGGGRRLAKLQESEGSVVFWQNVLGKTKSLRKDEQKFHALWTEWGSELDRYIRPKQNPHVEPKRRIGVGYRDKGTLASESDRLRKEANTFSLEAAVELMTFHWSDVGPDRDIDVLVLAATAMLRRAEQIRREEMILREKNQSSLRGE